MAKLSLYTGTTSKLLQFTVLNSSTGAPLTGLVFNTASLSAYYYLEGAAVAVAIPLVNMTLGTWVSGGFVAVDGTNCPGLYSLGLPNAAFNGRSVTIVLKGAANMLQVQMELELTATNNQDSAQGGILNIPALPTMFKRNQALSNFPFAMFSSADGITPEAGLTVVSMVSINGAAFVPTTNSAVSVSNGMYTINLAAADTNGATLMYMFSATGATTQLVSVITQA